MINLNPSTQLRVLAAVSSTLHASRYLIAAGGLVHVVFGAPVYAASTDVVLDLATTILGLLFRVGGAAAALVCAITGIKMMLSSVGESSRGFSSGLFNLFVVAFGVVLTFLGPTIAENLIKGVGTIKKDIYVP